MIALFDNGCYPWTVWKTGPPHSYVQRVKTYRFNCNDQLDVDTRMTTPPPHTHTHSMCCHLFHTTQLIATWTNWYATYTDKRQRVTFKICSVHTTAKPHRHTQLHSWHWHTHACRIDFQCAPLWRNSQSKITYGYVGSVADRLRHSSNSFLMGLPLTRDINRGMLEWGAKGRQNLQYYSKPYVGR
jgi:hypothetical protein